MSILFFDTETTGLPDYAFPHDAECQPHVVQLASLLTDCTGKEMAHLNMIVRSPVPIPEQASRVHGITDDVAERYGVHPKAAGAVFRSMASRADLIVAHNIKFDLLVTRALFARHGLSDPLPESIFCTVGAAAPIVNLPPTERMIAAGINKPKSPTLAECVKHFFGRDLDGAHDALVDVRACRDVFFEIRRRTATVP
ncbi:MAG: 3'-5' exonuclease [Methylacidiphilales bacterium]|nr:3'-5' exonuclease [Candidatus Methylacidiphilales bacterium]